MGPFIPINRRNPFANTVTAYGNIYSAIQLLLLLRCHIDALFPFETWLDRINTRLSLYTSSLILEYGRVPAGTKATDDTKK